MTDIEHELRHLRREVERLKSKDQIIQQLSRYGRGHEWVSAELLNEVFFDDAFVDFGFFTGAWRDYLPKLMELERSADSTFHLCAAPQIEFATDETAYVECYGISGGRRKTLTELVGGRYFLTFERRAGVWKIARCEYVFDWHLDQTREGAAGAFDSQINRVGERSSSNPLYRRMSVDVT
jgi:hypothetical protein